VTINIFFIINNYALLNLIKDRYIEVCLQFIYLICQYIDMQCPFCSSNNIDVVNSRKTKGDKQIWRRRKCQDCFEIFTTYEKINLDYLKIIKKSGKIVRFNRSKLFSGIYNASIQKKNVDRGDMAKLSEIITCEVEDALIEMHKKVISTEELKTLVLNISKKKDISLFFSFIAYFKDTEKIKDIRELLDNFC